VVNLGGVTASEKLLGGAREVVTGYYVKRRPVSRGEGVDISDLFE